MVTTAVRTPARVTDAQIMAFLPRARRYSVVDDARLTSLMRLASDVLVRDVPGVVMECGVANGGSACALAWAIRETDRHCWLYDSFEGLPQPEPVDGPNAPRFEGENKASVESVHRALDGAGFPLTRAHIVSGWFAETFAQPGPEQIALLHIDADWHASVGLALDTWYDSVASGGVIVLDDFGYWVGCRRAFYEFVARRHIAPDLARVGDQAWWVKD